MAVFKSSVADYYDFECFGQKLNRAGKQEKRDRLREIRQLSRLCGSLSGTAINLFLCPSKGKLQ